MLNNQSICLLIPALNEAGGLETILNTIPDYIDSDSTDNTAEVAKKHGADLVNEPRRGYGRAYKTGFDHIQEDWIVTLDADGTYPTTEIKDLVECAIHNGCTFLSGSRFPLNNHQAMSNRNFLGNLIITWWVNYFFKTKMIDSCSGMWVINRSCLSHLNLKTDDWSFSIEIKLAAALNHKIGFYEKPITLSSRIGETKLTNPWKIGLKILFYLLRKRYYK